MPLATASYVTGCGTCYLRDFGQAGEFQSSRNSASDAVRLPPSLVVKGLSSHVSLESGERGLFGPLTFLSIGNHWQACVPCAMLFSATKHLGHLQISVLAPCV